MRNAIKGTFSSAKTSFPAITSITNLATNGAKLTLSPTRTETGVKTTAAAKACNPALTMSGHGFTIKNTNTLIKQATNKYNCHADS